MSGTDGCCSPLVVVKLGGSVLSSERAYSRAAEFLAHRLAAAPGERFVAVVSAQEGSTDALENTARGIAHSPSSPALHLLWSTGEIRSVALLTLHLEALGISAAPLNVHETGLRVGASSSGPGRATLHPARLHAALGSTRVATPPLAIFPRSPSRKPWPSPTQAATSCSARPSRQPPPPACPSWSAASTNPPPSASSPRRRPPRAPRPPALIPNPHEPVRDLLF